MCDLRNVVKAYNSAKYGTIRCFRDSAGQYWFGYNDIFRALNINKIKDLQPEYYPEWKFFTAQHISGLPSCDTPMRFMSYAALSTLATKTQRHNFMVWVNEHVIGSTYLEVKKGKPYDYKDYIATKNSLDIIARELLKLPIGTKLRRMTMIKLSEDLNISCEQEIDYIKQMSVNPCPTHLE